MPEVPKSRTAPAVPAVAAAALLCAVTVIAYLPALRGGFMWDDDLLVTANGLVKSGAGLARLWFTTDSADYWPVTLTVFWIQWHLWGLHAIGYHAVNLALHAVEVVLLWGILGRLRIPGALLGALIFAVHPMNAESVAWISELKNLMAMLFFLLSVRSFLRTGAYLGAQGGGEAGPEGGGIAASLVFFTLGMLSKGSVAILPPVLLGLIAWRRRIAPRDLVRLAPFFAVGAALVLVDIWFQRHGTGHVIRSAGITERALGAGAVVWFYLGKALWPVSLAFVYPEWHIRASDPAWWVPLLASLGLTAVLWRLGRPWSRSLLFAWGFFCVALAPVMGFTDVYFMKYSLVADRYAHLALIGIAGLLAAGWGAWDGADRTGRRAGAALRLPQAAAAAVICVLALLTWRRCGDFRDARTVFRATLERNPGSWLALNYLGSTPPSVGRPDGIAFLEKALAVRPGYAEAHFNLGVALAAEGRMGEAVAHYREAIRLEPDFAPARTNLGGMLLGARRFDEAIVEFRAVERLDSADAQAHYNLGVALAAAGRLQEAIVEFGEAVRLRPDYVEAYNNLGGALRDAGRPADAAAQFERALRLAPGSFAAENNLGGVLMGMPGRLAEAVSHFEAAARLNPGSAAIQANLGFALAASGRLAEAIAHDQEALRLDPGLAVVHANLGEALRAAGRAAEAREHFDAAARLRAGP
jgi:tetratricopeptide (TPR) repeat protein